MVREISGTLFHKAIYICVLLNQELFFGSFLVCYYSQPLMGCMANTYPTFVELASGVSQLPQ